MANDQDAFREMLREELNTLRLGPARPLAFDHYAGAVLADHVEIPAGTTNTEEVHSVVAYCASPASGATLNLGGRAIPIPLGLTVMSGLIIKLGQSSTRSLVATGANCQLYLELMGEEIVGSPAASMGRN